jgi:hypothetical protein
MEGVAEVVEPVAVAVLVEVEALVEEELPPVLDAALAVPALQDKVIMVDPDTVVVMMEQEGAEAAQGQVEMVAVEMAAMVEPAMLMVPTTLALLPTCRMAECLLAEAEAPATIAKAPVEPAAAATAQKRQGAEAALRLILVVAAAAAVPAWEVQAKMEAMALPVLS